LHHDGKEHAGSEGDGSLGIQDDAWAPAGGAVPAVHPPAVCARVPGQRLPDLRAGLGVPDSHLAGISRVFPSARSHLIQMGT